MAQVVSHHLFLKKEKAFSSPFERWRWRPRRCWPRGERRPRKHRRIFARPEKKIKPLRPKASQHLNAGTK